MNSMVMINFLQQAKGREIMISQDKNVVTSKKWKFKWVDVEEFIFFTEGEVVFKSWEISEVREKFGILVLSNYEKNVKIEIEIL